MTQSRVFNDIKISYRPGTVDEAVLADTFSRNIYFIPEYVSRPDDVIIDVGAHIGTFTLCAAQRAPSGQVYAIEACRENFSLLEENVRGNVFRNIRYFHLALADADKMVKLYHNLIAGNWGHTTSKRISDVTEEVPANSLQSFMSAHKIARCDYMRLNCEGAEFEIILNTPAEMLQKIKLILILYHEDLADRYCKADLVKYLSDSGFKVALRNQTKRRGWLIAVNKKYPLPLNSRIEVGVGVFVENLRIFGRKLVNNIFRDDDRGLEP